MVDEFTLILNVFLKQLQQINLSFFLQILQRERPNACLAFVSTLCWVLFHVFSTMIVELGESHSTHLNSVQRMTMILFWLFCEPNLGSTYYLIFGQILVIQSSSLKSFHQTVKKILNTRCSLKSLDVMEMSVSRALACLCLLFVCWDNTHISYILHVSFVLHSVLLLLIEFCTYTSKTMLATFIFR